MGITETNLSLFSQLLGLRGLQHTDIFPLSYFNLRNTRCYH